MIDVPNKHLLIQCRKLCALCTLHLSTEIAYMFEGMFFILRREDLIIKSLHTVRRAVLVPKKIFSNHWSKSRIHH